MRDGAGREAPTARPRLRRAAVGAIVGVGALLAAACDGAPDLETRTFDLRYVDPGEAARAVEPYVYDERPDSPGKMSAFSGGLTVRETSDNLDQIARVLERVDRAKPAVRLHFQIIAADGSSGPDPRIADVESALRQLFRFEGYELLAEAQMGAVEGGSATQAVQEYWVRTNVQAVRPSETGGTVQLLVHFGGERFGQLIETGMSVPSGQTVVLGSAQVDPERPTLILTVRPELVPAGPGEDAEPAASGGAPGGF